MSGTVGISRLTPRSRSAPPRIGIRVPSPRAARAGSEVGLALLLMGCGHRAATAPAAPPPPALVATHPQARATRVPYDTSIWARFQEPLDPASVGPTTVFLKIDTRRIPVAVSLDDSGRRVVLEPTQPLALRSTHTVLFTTGVRTALGAPFAAAWQWGPPTGRRSSRRSPR